MNTDDEKRRDEVLKRMLNTPPENIKDMLGRKRKAKNVKKSNKNKVKE